MSTQKPGRSRLFVGATALVVLTSCCLLAAHHALAKEQEITAKELPKSIQKALGDLKIDEVERDTEKGVTIYEIDIEEGDMEVELKLDAEGRLLAIEIEDEDEDDDDDDEGDEDDEDDDEKEDS